ncbi:MAG: hypothetical protein ACFB03_09450 [Paracoccaceae bacterium]
MLTATEREICETRKEAAKSALLFFKGKHIKSANNPFHWVGNRSGRQAAWNTINNYRTNDSHLASVAQTVENVSATGVGNCEDKAVVLYFNLHQNVRLSISEHHHNVQIVGSVGWDHSFVIISDVDIQPRQPVDCYDLGKTCCIVDGWTEDWHFPNMSLNELNDNHLRSSCWIRQAWAREKIRRHKIGCTNANILGYKHVKPKEDRSLKLR